jgi:hypothetical protein
MLELPGLSVVRTIGPSRLKGERPSTLVSQEERPPLTGAGALTYDGRRVGAGGGNRTLKQI